MTLYALQHIDELKLGYDHKRHLREASAYRKQGAFMLAYPIENRKMHDHY